MKVALPVVILTLLLLLEIEASAVPPFDPHPASPARCELDAYQGNSCVKGTQKTGYFHVENVKGRLMWVSPEGHGMFSKAVEGVVPGDGGEVYQAALRSKYGPRFQMVFAKQALTRIQGWGFNTIGEYSAVYVRPWRTRYSPGSEVKLPQKLLLNLTGRTSYGFLHLQFKNLWSGLDRQAGCRNCYGGYLADVFDPGFATGVEEALKNVLNLQPTLPTEPYLMMITTDDGDNIFGLRRTNALHGGWLAAIMAPTQSNATTRGQPATYSDTKVYTKQAWVDYVQQKYNTIQGVNRAWGSSYTSFAGGPGWPKGKTGSTSVLDEDGTSAWFAARDRSGLTDLNDNLRSDLDAFRIMMAERYASTMSKLVRQYIPNHAISNPGPLNASMVNDAGGRALLQSFAKYYDVLTITGNCDEETLVTQSYDLVRKPLSVGIIVTAQRDSPQTGFKTPFCDTPAQAARGDAYAENLTAFFNSKGSDGVMPVVGMSWWEWTDKTTRGEKGNFGLVTNRDNAYDGVEDRTTTCTDRWGFKCGGEPGDYGDFVSHVRDANIHLDELFSTSYSAQH